MKKLKKSPLGPNNNNLPSLIRKCLIGGIVVIVIGLMAIGLQSTLKEKREQEVPYQAYSKFMAHMDEDQVAFVKFRVGDADMEVSTKNGEHYKTPHPRSENFKRELLEKGVNVEEKQGPSKTQLLVMSMMIPLGLMVMAIVLFRNQVKDLIDQDEEYEVEPSYPTKRLSDIAGHEEAKADLKNKVVSLLDKERYGRVGAKLPKGVLLVGPPGTGKTVMAEALAGEIGVPFFSAVGSDFVEMFVGRGARRIRDLFETAREHAPCIVFIDEIDAVGGQRSLMGTDSEREQTLNALLVELNQSDNVLIIGATNRDDMLDTALTRAGRFDTKIVLGNPNKEERLQIIQQYVRRKPLSEDVDIRYLQKITLGWSGAAIESMINEAAIICANDMREVITRADFETAHLKILTQGYKSNCKVDQVQREITAWHEAGHALCTKLLTKDEVHQVSIIPTTSGVGGYTLSLAQKEALHTREDLIWKVKIYYGGRAAEEIYSGSSQHVTTGAVGDITQATQIIKSMIGNYGMGQQGLVDLTVFAAGEDMILQETVELAQTLYQETMSLLRQHEVTLKALAEALLEREILSEEELDAIIKDCSL
ncbi:MAG: AAA family ATPase [Cellulosilyticaceae bacterium]